MATQAPEIREPIERSKAKIQTIYITKDYAWSQSKESIELYIPLHNANTISNDQYTLTVLSKSVGLEIRNHERANYSFKISHLHGQVVPHKHKVKRKPEKIVIYLQKQDLGKHWTDLQQKTTGEKYSDLERAERNGVRLPGVQDALKEAQNMESPFTLQT